MGIDTGIKKAHAARDNTRTSPFLGLQAKVAAALIGDRFRRSLGVENSEWFLTGAAATPHDVFEFFAAVNIPICELWAMSETSCVATVKPAERDTKGTVGRPMPGVEVEVAEHGELLVRGATVMHGLPQQAREECRDNRSRGLDARR